MIKPRAGIVLARKAKDSSKGYEVELPTYVNIDTGKEFYATDYALTIQKDGETFYLFREDTILADEVSNA